jgi:hypothetical protein
LFVKSRLPKLQLVLVIEPVPAELIVVVPAAMQRQLGDVRKFAAQRVASTLTEGGSA